MTAYGGRWTEEKLEIIYRYLDAYTTALKDRPFRLVYVDAFAGDGTWRPSSGYAPEDYGEFREILKGSAARALDVQDRPFDRLIFIEKSEERSANLRGLAAEHPHRKIDVFTEDANAKLPEFLQEHGEF